MHILLWLGSQQQVPYSMYSRFLQGQDHSENLLQVIEKTKHGAQYQDAEREKTSELKRSGEWINLIYLQKNTLKVCGWGVQKVDDGLVCDSDIICPHKGVRILPRLWFRSG